MTVYRPPVLNFALTKFVEVLDRAQQYLTQKEDENVRIILTEDLSFRPRVVEWVNSEEGFLVNVKPGIHRNTEIQWCTTRIH